MECPNCTFQNAPGTPNCLRCRSLLDLRSVDFLPPRLAQVSTIGRMQRAAGARLGRLGERLRDSRRAVRAPRPEGSWRHVAWSIVPGLGHLRAGRRQLGGALLGAWLLLLAVALLNVSTTLGWMCAFGAVSVHSAALSLWFARAMSEWRLLSRAIFGIALYLVLLGGLYGPLAALTAQCVTTLPLNGLREGALAFDPAVARPASSRAAATQSLLANGDVLLCTGPWTRPAKWTRGDLVVYQLRPLQLDGGYVVAGLAVDRIVAGPGDRLVIADGVMRVNGVEVPRELQPLSGLDLLGPRDMLVAADDEYVIFPTSLDWRGHGAGARSIAENVLGHIGRVRERDFHGKVIGRIGPWWRVGALGSEAGEP